jgi:hypothetical protein
MMQLPHAFLITHSLHLVLCLTMHLHSNQTKPLNSLPPHTANLEGRMAQLEQALLHQAKRPRMDGKAGIASKTLSMPIGTVDEVAAWKEYVENKARRLL